MNRAGSSEPDEVARIHFAPAGVYDAAARMVGHEVCLASARAGARCALPANEMDVLDVRVSRDHSINAAAS